MWRSLKAVASLAIIAASVYAAASGAVTWQFALIVSTVSYLGAEGVETVLAGIGQQQLIGKFGGEGGPSLVLQPQESDEQTDEETETEEVKR